MIRLRHLLGSFCLAAWAHDLPREVTVRVFLRPEAGRLQVLVRAPLASMRDVVFPQRGPGYLDFAQVDPLLDDAAKLWIAGALAMEEDGVPLAAPRVVATRLALEADPSFADFASAQARFQAPKLGNDTNVYWTQTQLDAWLEYPIRSPQSRFAVRSQLARLGWRVSTVLRFWPPGTPGRSFEFTGDPGWVHLNPTLADTVARFAPAGFAFWLRHTDSVLLALALLAPLAFRHGVRAVAALLLAHALALWVAAGPAPGEPLWWRPLADLLLALIITYTAAENVARPGASWRWGLAFTGGLVLGWTHALAWRESAQFAVDHRAVSVAAFHLGIDSALLLAAAALILVFFWLRRWARPPHLATVITSAFVAHAAGHACADRFSLLRQFDLPAPAGDAAFWAAAARTALYAAVAAGAAWAFRALWPRPQDRGPQDSA